MNEDFVTTGLSSDRFLKADHLVERFEAEIREALEGLSDRICEQNETLFAANVGYSWKYLGASASRTLATMRNEFKTNRRTQEGDVPLVNVAVEWVEPDEQDVASDTDGSLCYALYKIQHGSPSRFTTVKQRTLESGEWPQIYFGEDQWPSHAKEAPGIVFVPVETGEDLADGFRTLRDHFSTEYAPELRTLEQVGE